jgi:hypothetical protein
MRTCVRGRDLECVVAVVFKITPGLLPPAWGGSAHKALTQIKKKSLSKMVLKGS